MPTELPYFCWYPADCEVSENVKAMTDAELGFYLRCLNHSWLNHGLPADSKERARVLRVSPGHLEKMWVRVGRCFEVSVSDSSRIVNPRQEVERAKAISKSEKCAKSVRTRYERSANVGVPASESESESESEVQNGGGVGEVAPPAEPKPKRPPSEMDLRLKAAGSELSVEHPNQDRTLTPEDAENAIRAALKTVPAIERVLTLEAILRRHRARRDKWRQDLQYCPKLKKWLTPKDGEWKLEPQPQTALAIVSDQTRVSQMTFAERNEEIRNRKFVERMVPREG